MEAVDWWCLKGLRVRIAPEDGTSPGYLTTVLHVSDEVHMEAVAALSAHPQDVIDWTAYAAAYDEITWANPAYRDLVSRVTRVLADLEIPRDARVADLGAGTGTFTRLLAERFPAGKVHALDASEAFLARLAGNLASFGNLEIHHFDMNADPFPEIPLDLVLSVHAVCHAAEPQAVFRRVFDALKPGGCFVVADIGRPLRLADWSAFVLADLARNYANKGWGPLGILPALSFMWRHRVAARENRTFAMRQKNRQVWLHDLSEFTRALRGAGFEILESTDREFRGIDDFAIARRPTV
jgi:SAM-dependent methyltransferase